MFTAVFRRNASFTGSPAKTWTRWSFFFETESYLASEYQQFQDASALKEGVFDEEEGV